MTLAVALISLVVSRVAGDDSYHVLNGTSAAPTRCLDGSPAGLYFRASRSGSSRFVLYLEGGSDCADGERCAAVAPAVSRREGHLVRNDLRGARGTGERAVRHGAGRGGGRGTHGGGVGRVRVRTSAPGPPRAAGKVCGTLFGCV